MSARGSFAIPNIEPEPPNTPNTVAFILEREQKSLIGEWLKTVKLASDLTAVPLSDAKRTAHLPELLQGLIVRLRRGKSAPSITSDSADRHGKLRFAQGYSASMLVEESKIFEVTAFGLLHLHRHELNRDELMLDVITIADEADCQLEQTMRGFGTAGKPRTLHN